MCNLYHSLEFKGHVNWASEVSPTLGCSIKISRDIYCRYVCRVLKCLGGITYVHAQSQFWAVKTD